jgi:hypothetical protein
MSDVRDLLASQTASDTTGAQLNTVGGRVFLDAAGKASLNDLVNIGEAWRVVHAPTFGAPIPGTGSLTTHAMTGSDLENVVDVTSGVLKVQALSLTNGGPGPIMFDVYVGGVAVNADSLSADPGGFRAYAIPGPLFIDENTPLQVKVTMGTPTDGVVDVSTIRVAF